MWRAVIALIVQNSFLILLMRYTMLNRPASGPYLASIAVFFSELIKLLISIAMVLMGEAGGSLARAHDLIWREKNDEKVADMIALIFPALLYILQNNLQYIAVANLSSALFQVLYQMKIVTAALFSVTILGRRLRGHQWLSILLLTIGLATTQLSQRTSAAITFASSPVCTSLGLGAVILASITSGLAGVLIEKLIKGGRASSTIWVRNSQMGLIGCVVSAISCLLKDITVIQTKGLLVGFFPAVWGVIALQALGGLVVALVVKNADNVVKGFATSMSIVLSCVLSAVLFNDVRLNAQLLVGAATVIGASFWYGWHPKDGPEREGKRLQLSPPIH